MTHSVILSQNAEDDLFAIADWIAEQADRETADGYIDRLRAACLTLADFPDRGTPHPGFGADLRSVAFRRRSTIYYRVSPAVVTILHIVHAGRDPARLIAGREQP